MNRIIWLASFPRSGNTWVRSIVQQIQNPGSPLTMMQKYVPDLHGREIPAAFFQRENPVIKTHATEPANVRIINPDTNLTTVHDIETHRILYIIRNPMDVAISLFHFLILNSNADWAGSDLNTRVAALETFIDEFIETEGEVKFEGAVASTNLLTHVESWDSYLQKHGGILLRYEDLHSETADAIRRIGYLLGRTLNAQEIDLIIERTSFKSLQEIEEGEISHRNRFQSARELKTFNVEELNAPSFSEFWRPNRTIAYEQGLRFFRMGIPGTGRMIISRKQQEKMKETFKPIYQRFYQT